MKSISINNIDDLKKFFKDKKLNKIYFCNFIACHEFGWITLYSLHLRYYININILNKKGEIVALCYQGQEIYYTKMKIDYLLIIDCNKEITYYNQLQINTNNVTYEKNYKGTRYDIFRKLTNINNYLHTLKFKERINNKLLCNPKFSKEKFKNNQLNIKYIPIKENNKIIIPKLNKCVYRTKNHGANWMMLNWSDSFFTNQQIYGKGFCSSPTCSILHPDKFKKTIDTIFDEIKNNFEVDPIFKFKYILFIIRNIDKHPEKNTPINYVNKIIKKYYKKKPDYKVVIIHDIKLVKLINLPNIIHITSKELVFTLTNLYPYLVNAETIYTISAMFEFVSIYVNCNVVIPIEERHKLFINTRNLDYLIKKRGKKFKIVYC